MTTILCFGDSNTWGLCPATGQRLPAEQRWPCLLEGLLSQAAEKEDIKVIEAGQPNRTLIHHCSFSGSQSGGHYLADLLHQFRPQYLVIMLGTNDLKAKYHYKPRDFVGGLEALLNNIFNFYHEHTLVSPQFVVLSPLAPLPVGHYTRIYAGAVEKLPEVIAGFKRVCEQYQINFVDCNQYVQASSDDGVHLSAIHHHRLAEVIAPWFIRSITALSK